jgi:hypothetical protein
MFSVNMFVSGIVSMRDFVKESLCYLIGEHGIHT